MKYSDSDHPLDYMGIFGKRKEDLTDKEILIYKCDNLERLNKDLIETIEGLASDMRIMECCDNCNHILYDDAGYNNCLINPDIIHSEDKKCDKWELKE